MKSRYTLLFILVTAFLLGFSPGALKKVEFVYDGDTVLLGSGESVRYLGIDAPETAYKGGPPGFMAEEALAFNEKMVKGKEVRLQLDREKHDRYGRLLAYVYLPNGQMVNIRMLEKGFACVLVVPPNIRHLDRLIEAQREAMTARKGIWSREVDTGCGPYVGNRKSFRFHRRDCPYGARTHPANRVVFEGRRDAFWEGYSPCKKCRP
jgi:micrococcal nuclease